MYLFIYLFINIYPTRSQAAGIEEHELHLSLGSPRVMFEKTIKYVALKKEETKEVKGLFRLQNKFATYYLPNKTIYLLSLLKITLFRA